MPETYPLLLDTDIGSDIDDAVALSYLLRQTQCELLGIAAGTGQASKRAALADAVCRAAGREGVPVHVGAQTPLLVPPRQTEVPHFDAIGRWPHGEYGDENTAVAFLRDTIRARPHAVTLLAIGPLSNVALLFSLAPDVPALLKQMVVMGGEWFGRTAWKAEAEWNILNDPHAAQVVFAAPVPRILCVGLDVTNPLALGVAECRERFAAAGGPLSPTLDMAETWFSHVPRITFHDPLAAAVVFCEDLCEWERGRVSVELTSERAAGVTYFDPDPDGPHRVARAVNGDAFFSHFFSVVGGA